MQGGFILSTPVLIESPSWLHGRTQQRVLPRFAAVNLRKRCRSPVALASNALISQSIPLLLAEEDLTRQIFMGGIGIIMSGIVGVFIVSLLIRNNMEAVSNQRNTLPRGSDRFAATVSSCLTRLFISILHRYVLQYSTWISLPAD
ncbi:unnamed protein product [Chondrus crispus]|uniref:Uncharacterized protein n=1 Tax=Chondrus crispus TaxID=2769 RepID=R7Q8J4_CHOCR|nr:unnamed protein product [Chondrus crispus]CDF34113.1 unnamed protein product [Chondrus crispus]|eukprot:XP_005713932.1 unnamed protein product [Chondrus crispus]